MSNKPVNRGIGGYSFICNIHIAGLIECKSFGLRK